VHADDGSGHTANQGLALNITGGSLQITTTSLPDGRMARSTARQFKRPADRHRTAGPSELFAPLPPNCHCHPAASSPARIVTNGTFYFDVHGDGLPSATFDQTLSLTVVNPPLPPLIVTNVSLPRATSARPTARNWGYWGRTAFTTVGALGSASPPPGLTLQSSG